MGASILTALLFLLVLAHVGFGQNNNNNNNNNSNRRLTNASPGFTANGSRCPVTDGCVRVPHSSDVMTIPQFQAAMAGRRYYVIYRIDHVPMGVLNRQESVYTIEGNTVYGELKARMQDGTCLNLPRLDIGNFASDRLAILTKDDFPFFGVPGTHNPIFYFISDNPSQYQILFVCLDRSSIRNGVCEGRYFLDIGVTQDPPNSPPYYEIEMALRRIFGLSLSDRLNKFQYIGMGKLTIVNTSYT
ncbi:hypothetical protein ACF0H5_003167 [Mactra antiquata]